MSDSTPHRPGADRNLLFGVLALQMDFVQRDALLAAMNAWVLDKARPLGQILVERQALRPDRRDLLEALVAQHLEVHGGDAEQSLAALGVPPLRDGQNGDLQATLSHVPAGPPSTVAYEPTADGGRYQVLRPHARGGLGAVFVALDQELHREVALKEIDAQHADDAHSRGRFVREAEITGGLEHPGVVPVYGLGRHADGRPYYAMRLIRGETLHDALARFHQRPAHALSHDLEFRQLLGRFVAVCNAVAYAHSRGVIHRDLKPSNIMLGPYGETLVVDWGLAKAVGRDGDGDGAARSESTLVPVLDGEPSATRTGAALGTPAYMSPEQAAGRLDRLGPASDVYSLGATLYALLTGRPPVQGNDAAEIMARVQRGDWPAPRQVKAEVPAALDAVCRKALALEPADRYAAALKLAAEVERWLADEPVSAWREPWAVRGRRWLGRHRTLVTAAAAALVVSIVALTVGLVLLAAAADAETAARKKAEDKEREARRSLYIAQMSWVQREYDAGNIEHVRELLAAQADIPPGGEDLRGFEWHYWNRILHWEQRTLKAHGDGVQGVAFSPDGRRIVSRASDGIVKWWDTATGQEMTPAKVYIGPVESAAFSPDGLRIAGGSHDGTIKVWDAASGQITQTFKGHTRLITGLAFSPDGRQIAGNGPDNSVRVWDAATGQEVLTFMGHTSEVYCVAFSPDGRQIAGGSTDGTVRVWDVVGGREACVLRGHTDLVRSLAFIGSDKTL
jgi:tRNA A-37 threonylcarbamoyl transferase component Bud32